MKFREETELKQRYHSPQVAGYEVNPWMVKLVSAAWKEEEIPLEWIVGELNPLPLTQKKRTDCAVKSMEELTCYPTVVSSL